MQIWLTESADSALEAPVMKDYSSHQSIRRWMDLSAAQQKQLVDNHGKSGEKSRCLKIRKTTNPPDETVKLDDSAKGDETATLVETTKPKASKLGNKRPLLFVALAIVLLVGAIWGSRLLALFAQPRFYR